MNNGNVVKPRITPLLNSPSHSRGSADHSPVSRHVISADPDTGFGYLPLQVYVTTVPAFLATMLLGVLVDGLGTFGHFVTAEITEKESISSSYSMYSINALLGRLPCQGSNTLFMGNIDPHKENVENI